MKGISIDALLRLKTAEAEKQLIAIGNKQKPINIPIKFDRSDISKAFADITAIAISNKLKSSFDTIGDDLVKKIETAFSKSQVKSKGSGLLGGLKSALAAPLQGLARGAFEGVGREISSKFGKGLSSGLESQIAQFAGSTEFLGEKLVSKIVPELSKTAIARIKATSLGKQLAIAMQDLDVDAARENLKQRFRDLLGDSDLLIEQEFNQSQNKKTKSKRLKTARKEVGTQLQDELKLQPQTELRNQQIQGQIKTLEQLSSKERSRLRQLARITKPDSNTVKEIETLVRSLAARKKELEKLSRESQKLFKPEAQQKLSQIGVNTKNVDAVISTVDRTTSSARDALSKFKQSEQSVKADLDFANTQIPLQQERLAKLQQAAKQALSSGEEALAKEIVGKLVDTKQNIASLQKIIDSSTDKLQKIASKQAELTQIIDSDRDQKLFLALQEQIQLIQQSTNQSASEVAKAIALGQQQTLNNVINNAKKQAIERVKKIEGAIAKGSTVSESAIKQGESEIAQTALGKLIEEQKRLQKIVNRLQKERSKLNSDLDEDTRDEDAIKAVNFLVEQRVEALAKVNQKIREIAANNVDIDALSSLKEKQEKLSKKVDKYLEEKQRLESEVEENRDDAAIKAVDFFLTQKQQELSEVNQALDLLNKNFLDYQKYLQNQTDKSIFETAQKAAQNLEKARAAVSNIDEVGDREFERLNDRLKQIVAATEQVTQKAATIGRKTDNKSTRSVSEPQKIVNAIAREVEKISGVAFESIPEVKLDPNLAKELGGSFNNKENAIKLSSRLFSNLDVNNLNKEVIEVIAHELRHAIQFQLAQATGGVSRLIRSGQLIESNESESQIIAKFVELSSRNAKGNLTKEQVAALEEDAYTFAYRYLEQIQQNVSQALGKASQKSQSKNRRDLATVQQGKSEAEKLLSQISPTQLPQVPAISSRAFPVVDNANKLEQFLEQQVSASGLKEIVKRLGLGTDSPVSKVAIERIVNSYKEDALKVQELIARLGDDIRYKKTQTGASSTLGNIEDEPALTETFKTNNRLLRAAYQKLESLSDERARELAEEINAIALAEVEAIDRVTREFKVAGDTARSLSGTRSGLTNLVDRTALNKTTVPPNSTESLKDAQQLYSAGTPRSNNVTAVVNAIALAVEAEIEDTVVKTIGNIIKSPTGRDLSKEAAVNGVGLIAGKAATAASGGVPGVGLVAEYGASAITRKAVSDIESSLDALAIVLDSGAGETRSQLNIFLKVVEEATAQARRKSAATRQDLDKDTAGFAIGNIAAATSQQLGANVPLIGAATAIASTNSAIALREKIRAELGVDELVNNIIDGITTGVANSTTRIGDAGQRIANELLEGFRDRLGIKSPARRFIEEMKFVALGVAVGVEHHLKTAIKAGARLGDELATGFAKSNIAKGQIADRAAKQVEKQIDKIERQNERAAGFAINRIEQNLKRAEQIIERGNRDLDRVDRQNEVKNARRIAQTQARVFNNQGIGESPIQPQQEEVGKGVFATVKTAIASIQNDLRNSGLQKAVKEAQNVTRASQDLLSNLEVTVTVGRDAAQKIRQAQSSIARLEAEQRKLIKDIDKLTGAEKLAVKAQVERIQAQLTEETERIAGLRQHQAEAKKLLPIYRRLERLNEELQTAIANQDLRGIRRLNSEINRIHTSLNQSPPARNGFLPKLQRQLERIGLTTERVKKGAIGLATLFAGSLLIGGFDDVIRDFSRSTFEVTNRFEQLQTQINFAAGSAKVGAQNFQFISAKAKRLKVDLEQAAAGFSSLSAATKNSERLKGETENIFKVISQSSRVTGGTAQQTEAAFLAIQQMISGGTLQLEELRQLGESGGIKGVFDIAQKALGAADGELKKLISTGTIAVDDFLPKFIKQLDLVTRSGVSESLKTTAAALTNLQNEFKLLQVEIGKATQDITRTAINAIAVALELVRNNLHVIFPILKTTALLLTTALLPTVISLAKLVGGFLLTGLGKVVSLLVATNTQFLATNAQLTLLATTSPKIAFLLAHLNKLITAVKLLGTGFLALGAVVVLSQVAEAFINTTRAGQEARDAVREINDAILDLDKTLNSIGKQQLLPENLTTAIAAENKKALLEQQNFAQKAVDKSNGFVNDVIEGFTLGLVKNAFGKYEDAAVSRIVATTGDAIAANQKLLQKADNALGLGDLTDKGTEEIQAYADSLTFANQSIQKTLNSAVDPNQIQELNAELAQNQKRLELYNKELTKRDGLELNLARIAVKRNDTITAAQKAENKAIAAIDAELLKSGDFKKDVELQKLQATSDRIDAELAAETLALKQIKQLAADGKGIDPNTGKPLNAQQLKEFEKTEKRIIELTRSAIETRASLLSKEVEQKIAEYDRYLEKAEGRRQKAEEKAIAFEKERLIAIQRLVNSEVLTVEQAEELKLKAKSKQLKANLDLEKKKLRQLKKFKSDEVQAQEKADQDIKTSKTKILDLTLQLLEQGKQAEEKTINAIAQSGENIFTQLEARLSRLSQIAQSRAGLISDRATAEEKLQDLQLAKLRQALELRKQLNSNELSSVERQAIVRQLVGLGVEGKTSELALLDKIEAKERQIAESKLKNLKIQQQLATQQLDLENQQLILTTKKDKIASKKALNEAKKEVDSAETAIALAQTPEELKQANTAYNLAVESLKLAQEEVEITTQQEEGLAEIIAQKQDILDLNNAIALAEVRSQDRDVRSNLEKERNAATEKRDRRLGRNLDKYISTQEKIDKQVESVRSKVESQGKEFTGSDETRLRSKLLKSEAASQKSEENVVRRKLLGSNGFTVQASPEVLELIRDRRSFLVPQVPATKTSPILDTAILDRRSGSLDKDSLILQTLKNIESKFVRPTTINVQNENQFTNVYDKSNTDEVPRIVRSEMVDLLNNLEQEINNSY